MPTTDAIPEHDECWVCGATGPGMHQDGSPLGGAFSAPKCEPCTTHRAATPQQGAWFMSDEIRWKAEQGDGFRDRYDLDGTEEHDGVAASILEGGRYIPFTAWRDSRQGRKALEVYRIWHRHGRMGWFTEGGAIPPKPSWLRRAWWLAIPYVRRPRMTAICISRDGRKKFNIY